MGIVHGACRTKFELPTRAARFIKAKKGQVRTNQAIRELQIELFRVLSVLANAVLFLKIDSNCW